MVKKKTPAKKNNSKKTGRKQTELPGVERKKDKELDGMILALYETRTERIDLQKDEAGMSGALIEKLKAKKLTSYVCIDGEHKYPCLLVEGAEKVTLKQEDA